MRGHTERLNVDEQARPKWARVTQPVPGTCQVLLIYIFQMNEPYVSAIEMRVTKRGALNEQS